MKKTFIKVKRGLLDAKHCRAMGEAVWLYIYLLDRVDWDEGTVYDYKDRDAAEYLGKSRSSIILYREKLQDGKYIKTTQKQHSQEIVINNWENPKDGSKNDTQGTNQDTNNLVPSLNEGTNQGTSQGTNQGNQILDTLLLTSDNQTIRRSEEEQLPSSPPVPVSPDDWKAEYSLNREQYMEFEKADTVLILNILLSVAGFYPPKRESDTVIKTIIHIAERHKIEITPKTSSQVADILRPYYLAWCKRKSKNGHPYSKTSLVWLLEWAAVGEIPAENIPKKDKLTVADIGQQLSKDEIRSMADDLRAAKKARQEKGIPVEIPVEVDA